MLGNRGASLTTESSAAFPSAEDASPDSRILNRNTAEAQPLTLKEEVSLLGTRPFIQAYDYRLCEFTTPRSASVIR